MTPLTCAKQFVFGAGREFRAKKRGNCIGFLDDRPYVPSEAIPFSETILTTWLDNMIVGSMENLEGCKSKEQRAIFSSLQ